MKSKGNILPIIAFLIIISQWSLTTNAQDMTVPGRIVVEFKPNVITIPTGLTKTAVTSSVVFSSSVLSALNTIQAYELETVFPYAIPGQTQIVSPITGNLVAINQ